MPMSDKTYEDGLNEGRTLGRIEAIENIITEHDSRLDHHEKRLQLIEKIIYGLVGAYFLISLIPKLQGVLT